MSASKTPSKGSLFLNCSALRPGDVLLTRGSGRISNAIAVASGGRYSHAVLVVQPPQLFESDDIGVGYSCPRIDRVELHGKERVLLSALKGVQEAIVLRHPDVDARSAKQIGAKLHRILRPLVGREYPEWRKLSKAASGGAIGKGLARVVLRVLDVMESQDVKNPGPFCSQVVCGALQEAFPPGIKCFEKKRDPATVGPNDFLSSRLKPVAGSVRRADKSAVVDENYLKGLNVMPPMSRELLTGSAVKNLRKISEIKDVVKAVRRLRRGGAVSAR
jgi:hypothetical protein